MRELADLTYTRARSVVIVAVAMLVLAVPLAATVFDRVEPFDIADPDSEVERAYAAFEESSGHGSDPEVVLLLETPTAAGSGAGQSELEAVAQRLAAVEGIAVVETPAQNIELRSTDQQAALIIGLAAAGEIRDEIGERVEDTFADDADVRARVDDPEYDPQDHVQGHPRSRSCGGKASSIDHVATSRAASSATSSV